MPRAQQPVQCLWHPRLLGYMPVVTFGRASRRLMGIWKSNLCASQETSIYSLNGWESDSTSRLTGSQHASVAGGNPISLEGSKICQRHKGAKDPVLWNHYAGRSPWPETL